MAITQATSSVLAANAALNNLNAGASIVFTKQVIIPSLSGAAFGTGVITALAATANTGSGLVTVDGTATLTNKTLTTPTIAQINAQGNNPLAIVGNTISQDGILSIRNSNSQQNSVVRFNDWTSGSRGVVGIGNTSSALYPSTIYMQGTAGVPLVLGTNDTERLRILSGGQVGIGTSTPNSTAVLELSSTTRGFLPPRMSTTERDAITSPPDGLVIHNTTTNKPNVRSAGAWIEVAAGLGIGVAEFLASPTSDNLRAAVTNETGTEALVFANGPTLIAPNIGAATGTSLALSGNLTVDTSTLVVDSVNDRIGIGTTNPQSGFRLDVNGWAVIRGDHYVNGNLIEFGTSAYRLHKTGANWINGGNLGIGTTSPSERLTVSGNISATGNITCTGHLAAATKSFKIPHQTKDGYLQYGVVESNEHSVYVRGKTSEETITLPDHWSWLVDPHSVTVSLTPYGSPQSLYVISADNQRVYVGGATGEYSYVVYGTRQDVEALVVETEE